MLGKERFRRPPPPRRTDRRVRRGAAGGKDGRVRRAQSCARRDRCCTGRPTRRLSRISDRSRRQNGMRTHQDAAADDDANTRRSHLSISGHLLSYPVPPAAQSSKCQCHIPVSALPGGPLADPSSTVSFARAGHTPIGRIKWEIRRTILATRADDDDDNLYIFDLRRRTIITALTINLSRVHWGKRDHIEVIISYRINKVIQSCYYYYYSSEISSERYLLLQQVP